MYPRDTCGYQLALWLGEVEELLAGDMPGGDRSLRVGL